MKRMKKESPIPFNELIDSANYLKSANRYIDETMEILQSPRWNNKGGRKGVQLSSCIFDFYQNGKSVRQSPKPNPTIKASVQINAPRKTVFSLLSSPDRAAEWDSTDLGYEWVEQFDEQQGVYSNINKIPLLGLRHSLLFRVQRATFTPQSSLSTIRAVQHDQAPKRSEKPMYQQIFAWMVEDVSADSCKVTSLSSAPEGMLPFWLLKIITPAGWVSILNNIKLKCET